MTSEFSVGVVANKHVDVKYVIIVVVECYSYAVRSHKATNIEWLEMIDILCGQDGTGSQWVKENKLAPALAMRSQRLNKVE